MMTWELIAEKARALRPEQQSEVLDFIEHLRERRTVVLPLHNPAGLLGDLGVDISEEDLSEARREMWGDFPREA